MKLAVEGPLAYFDVVTDDKRLLLSSSFTLPRKPLPIFHAPKGSCRSQQLGWVERVEHWGDVLWGYGVLENAQGRAHVSLSVSGSQRLDGETLVFENWSLVGVVFHGSESTSPWSGHETYLEVSE